MNFIVFDLEATCWNGHQISETQEIIEIGAVLMNNYGEIEKDFSEFVQPFVNPTLSAYCRELTSITQKDVNRARSFPDVIEDFKDWVNILNDDYVLCSWGKFDKKMLINDCLLHNCEIEWIDKHLNIKRQYAEVKKLKKEIGLKWAIAKEEFEFEGIQHRAIYDAINTAKIFARYLDEWSY